MYRYARTRSRVHRVVIEGGRAFKVENCNLDDVGFLNLVDVIPDGTRCAWCWAGYVEPTPEQKAAESAENAKREETVKEEIPPGAKPIPLVTSTRRMALVALLGAGLLGTAAGVLASPDQAKTVEPDNALVILRERIDELFVQVRVLSVDINGHTHEPSGTQEPIVIVLPTAAPVATSDPTLAPSTPIPTPSSSESTSQGAKTVTDETVSTNRTTIIVVPLPTVGPGVVPQILPTPAPTAEPTPQVTPVPTPEPTAAPEPTCFRPGVAGGTDRCKWPQN